MLNKEKHQLIMGRILRDIYRDATIAPFLGFKGGTCAYFFYELPRFSVDLDFDLFSNDESIKKRVFKKTQSIAKKYGILKEGRIKHYTIFFLISYGDTDHNIKIEINTRMLFPNLKDYYDLREYLGISMWVGKREYLFASKLLALTLRKETAMRDIYDIWFFSKNNWGIDAEIIERRAKKNIKRYLKECVTIIESVKDNQILQGLGEFLNAKEKAWVKNYLRKEVIFSLKNYQSVLQ